MEPLFLFGTLQHRPLLEAVLGHFDDLHSRPAVLRGYNECAVAEGLFSTMISASNGAVEGLVIRGLCAEDRDRLDFYESIFGYERLDVVLADGQGAQAYFPPEDRWTDEGPWEFEAWVRDWGAMSVLAAAEVMEYRGWKTPEAIANIFPSIRARACSTLNAQRSRHGELTLQGAVEVSEARRLYSNYFALEEYDLRHERFDGTMGKTVMRTVFRAPDAALVLPYDPHRDAVLLVEQMRMGPLARGDRTLWQLEPIAGRVDAGELPEVAARREAREEAGIDLGELLPVAEVYCSPGNSSEFYYVYVGIADLPGDVAGVGGLAEEHEDIRSHVLSFDRLMEMCDGLKFGNAPLVMAAYWLARHRGRLREQAGIR